MLGDRLGGGGDVNCKDAGEEHVLPVGLESLRRRRTSFGTCDDRREGILQGIWFL